MITIYSVDDIMGAAVGEPMSTLLTAVNMRLMLHHGHIYPTLAHWDTIMKIAGLGDASIDAAYPIDAPPTTYNGRTYGQREWAGWIYDDTHRIWGRALTWAEVHDRVKQRYDEASQLCVHCGRPILDDPKAHAHCDPSREWFDGTLDMNEAAVAKPHLFEPPMSPMCSTCDQPLIQAGSDLTCEKCHAVFPLDTSAVSISEPEPVCENCDGDYNNPNGLSYCPLCGAKNKARG